MGTKQIHQINTNRTRRLARSHFVALGRVQQSQEQISLVRVFVAQRTALLIDNVQRRVDSVLQFDFFVDVGCQHVQRGILRK